MDDAERARKKAEAQQERERKKAERQVKADQRRANAEAERAKRDQEQRELDDKNLHDYGNLIEKISFQGKELHFFSKGYVKVVTWSTSVPFEKILHVSVGHTVIKKSPGARRATSVGLMMMGLPPVNKLASDERMDWTVTLQTSAKTHQFSGSGRSTGDTALKIEALASSLIATAALAAPTPPSSEAGCSGSQVLDQVAKLKELFDAGVLTDEEFSSKKAQLLERL